MTDSRAYDRWRNRSLGRQMMNSRRWRSVSKAFLAEPGNGICHHCRRVPATMVDHRIAHKGNPHLFWDRANWVPCCGPCNSRKAAQAEGGFGNAPGAFKPRRLKGVDVDGWPLGPTLSPDRWRR